MLVWSKQVKFTANNWWFRSFRLEDRIQRVYSNLKGLWDNTHNPLLLKLWTQMCTITA